MPILIQASLLQKVFTFAPNEETAAKLQVISAGISDASLTRFSQDPSIITDVTIIAAGKEPTPPGFTAVTRSIEGTIATQHS